MKKKKKYTNEAREKKGQRSSRIDFFLELRAKYEKFGGGFFDWLKREREAQKK
jgi:hypothetical protein